MGKAKTSRNSTEAVIKDSEQLYKRVQDSINTLTSSLEKGEQVYGKFHRISHSRRSRFNELKESILVPVATLPPEPADWSCFNTLFFSTTNAES